MAVSKPDDQVADGLEVAGVLERSGVDPLKAHGLDQGRDFIFRRLVVARVEDLWGGLSRDLFQEKGEHRVEGLDDFRRAGLFLDFLRGRGAGGDAYREVLADRVGDV